MKKIVVMLMAGVLFAAVPAMADMTKEEKDQCLLAAKGCLGEVDTIQKQVKKLQAEIKKGSKVYTQEELQTLEQKLKDVKEFMKNMGKPGGR